MASLTVFDAYSRYLEVANPNVKPMLKSVFVRFLVPCWGGQALEGSRATPFEIDAAQHFLKKLPVNTLIGSADTLEEIFEQKNVTKQNRKAFRSIYKTFLKWAEENNYFLSQEPEPKPNVKINLFRGGFKYKTNHHGRVHRDAYSLMASYKGKLLYENDYINDKLKEEIEQFQKFRRDNNCSTATIDMETNVIYQILGWLHRYKDVSLENLTLNSIISYQKLSVSTQDCLDNNGNLDFSKQSLKKATTQQTAKELSKENRKTIEEYLDFIGGHPKSKVLAVVACKSVAKFIFRNELDDDEYVDESDLPIVKRLNQLNKKLNEKAKQTPPTIPHSHKSISWEYVEPLLDKLREKACTYYFTCIDREKERRFERTKTAIFSDLQDFLSIAFMTLMPPDRARTFYELEIGRTLVRGVHENDIFTPIDRLEENKKNASKWHIHLQPEDYKTGKVYGEFWGEVPNYQFSDGTFFYDFIEKWINEGREYKQKCDHHYFFRGNAYYKKFSPETWAQMIRTIFYRETGVPVSPKELRKMYVTYLKDQEVSEAVLEAAATSMKHSRSMQSKIYDQQNKTNKMAPILEFNERMFDKNQNPT